jgi:hypothetical protein
MKPQEIAHLPADTFFSDELANDHGIIEMANLDKSQTGVDGIVWISTMMTSHAPTVKYLSGLDERHQVFRSPSRISRG